MGPARSRPSPRWTGSSSATTPPRPSSTPASGGCWSPATASTARPPTPSTSSGTSRRSRPSTRSSAPATAGSYFACQQGTPRPGTPWGTGAIGVARWTGVRLADVLRHAGLRPDATSVMAVGLDDPYVEDGVDHGRVRRPLPLAKALEDVLVVWEMNGRPLPLDHGFPVRLIVPGWVGVASIKWLGELRVTTASGAVAVEHHVVPDARRGLVRRAGDARPDAGQERRRHPRSVRGRPPDHAAWARVVGRGDHRPASPSAPTAARAGRRRG